MIAFLIRRIAAMLAVLVVVSFVVFALIQAPATDLADVAVSEAVSLGNLSTEAAAEMEARIRAEFGLDRPVLEQYLMWMSGVVRGDFGQSLKHNKPVAELIGERLPRTLVIALFAHFCATVIGVSLGIYAATHQNRIGDQAATLLSFLGMTIPRFFLALIIVYFSSSSGARVTSAASTRPNLCSNPGHWPNSGTRSAISGRCLSSRSLVGWPTIFASCAAT